MQKKATRFNTTFFLINSVYSEIFVLSAAEPGQIRRRRRGKDGNDHRECLTHLQTQLKSSAEKFNSSSGNVNRKQTQAHTHVRPLFPFKSWAAKADGRTLFVGRSGERESTTAAAAVFTRQVQRLHWAPGDQKQANRNWKWKRKRERETKQTTTTSEYTHNRRHYYQRQR